MKNEIGTKVDYSIEGLIENAIDVLKNEYEYDDIDSAIHEIADNEIPIYYWDIAQYAAWNTELMMDIPECGRECEPYKQIQLNIYEAICEGLYEHVAEKEKEDAVD